MNRPKKILIVLGMLVGLGILAGYIRHRQLRAAVDSYLAELKAKGEPLDLAQILPPTLPLEKNGGDTLLEAMVLFRLFRVFRGILDWVGIRVSRLGVHGMRLRRRLFLGRKWRGPQPLGLFCARRGRVPRGQATAPPARARRRPTSLAPLGSISSSSFPWMVDPEFCGFRSHRLSSPS
jgi:hypothetical protein